MRSAPRTSVRMQLGFAIFATIVTSWVLSGGLTGYISYLNMMTIHQQMLTNPEVYPVPIPEPKFGIMDFLIGPWGFGRGRHGMGRPPGPPMMRREQTPERAAAGAPKQMMPPPGPPPPPDDAMAFSMMGIRLAVALLLALMTSSWLSRKFTKPLMELSRGAAAFQTGKLHYRIPIKGHDEFSDVGSAMNDMAERVAGQIGKLEQDARSRRQFLANVAHELRSPVTTMRTMAGALDEGLAEDPERRKRAVGALVRTSERLLRLITELLELARLDLKELPLTLREVDLREVIDTSLHSHSAQISDAKMILHTSTPDAPVMAVVDPDRLAQVLDNLVENAIAYAGSGTQLQISLEDSDPIGVAVTDNGRGIPAKDVPFIFDPFYRIDQARTPGGSHSGLGLSIVRGLVEAHGGTLHATSTEGKGTSFMISIPRGYQIPQE